MIKQLLGILNMRSVLILLLGIFTIQSITAQEIVYRGLGENRDGYHTELLQLIFQHVEKADYQVKRYPDEIPHQRAFNFLAANTKLDIVIGYATEDRIEKYRAIHIPIMKGLNGWRVSLIHKDNKNLFANIKNVADLRNFSPGLFHTWTDNRIFAANGINISKGTDFIGLFRMLDQKRFDYYPLSILEVQREEQIFQQNFGLDIIIDPNLVIRYPVCFYFYVNKDNQQLADDINKGFEAIIANGKFEQLFNQYFGDIVTYFRDQNRRFVDLTNPILPKQVPLTRKELWLQP